MWPKVAVVMRGTCRKRLSTGDINWGKNNATKLNFGGPSGQTDTHACDDGAPCLHSPKVPPTHPAPQYLARKESYYSIMVSSEKYLSLLGTHIGAGYTKDLEK